MDDLDIPDLDVPELDAADTDTDAPDPFETADAPAADQSLGNYTDYSLENPDTGNTVDWSSSEGYTDTVSGEPVDYWKTESI